MIDYPAPLSGLLTLGEPSHGGSWPDYVRRFGLTTEHIPDLIRMATDPELNLGDPESEGIWAPLYAWRALGQLRAEAAAEPLLGMLADSKIEDDYALDEIPTVLAMIGPPALPGLESVLAGTRQGAHVRIAAAEALGRMPAHHPETRERCIAALVRELERPGNDPEVGGFVLSALLELNAGETAPVIERAFAAGRIDESIAGDWPYVQYELGLTDEPPPQKQYVHLPSPWELPSLPGDTARPGPSAKARAKKRRKEARKSKKRNRKKK